MSKKGILIVVSGFSGAGKGTIMKHLLKKHPGEYHLSISATTRGKRQGEEEGREGDREHDERRQHVVLDREPDNVDERRRNLERSLRELRHHQADDGADLPRVMADARHQLSHVDSPKELQRLVLDMAQHVAAQV